MLLFSHKSARLGEALLLSVLIAWKKFSDMSTTITWTKIQDNALLSAICYRKFDKYQCRNNCLLIRFRWFGLVLDGMGTALVLILMVLIVSLRVSGAGDLQGGYAGMFQMRVIIGYLVLKAVFSAFALASTAGLTPILSALALNAVETEAKINSVERIKEYDGLEQEAPAVIKENRPPKEWPEKGRITFKDASLRYRQGELVLKKLNVTIDGEEKVGIVGRTGAGKST